MPIRTQEELDRAAAKRAARVARKAAVKKDPIPAKSDAPKSPAPKAEAPKSEKPTPKPVEASSKKHSYSNASPSADKKSKK
jgi:hypothetical protein